MVRTDELIIDTFWELLDEKPYSKITVRDIVERCHINRNTFYYHFEGIPSLLMETMTEWGDKVIAENGTPDKSLDLILTFAQGFESRKRALRHIYQSVERDNFETQLIRMADKLVTEYFDRVTKVIDIPEDRLLYFIRLYKACFVGLILDWFECGQKYDLVDSCRQIWKEFHLIDPVEYMMMKKNEKAVTGDGSL